jgi:hypothetical protein
VEQARPWAAADPGTRTLSSVLCRIVTHEGHNTFWTITYWFGREIAPSEVSVTFSWPEQGLEVLFAVSGEDLRYAINQATELWIPDPHGYFSA